MVIIFIQSVLKYRGSAQFCWLFVGGSFEGSCYFLSKFLGLVVHFNFKSIKFDSWHQNITGKI